MADYRGTARTIIKTTLRKRTREIAEKYAFVLSIVGKVGKGGKGGAPAASS